MKFKRKKYTDLLKYILFKCYNKPNFGKTVLCSILYFIDFNYYMKYGKLITNETYIKSKKGIEPQHFREVSNDLLSKKQLYLKKEPYYHHIIHRYYLTILPEINFSNNELNIINKTICHLNNNNATTITNYAIKNRLIKVTEIGDEIKFEKNK